MSPGRRRGSVVVGLDGSEHSSRALRWAAEQAHFEHRPLMVVAAVGPSHQPARHTSPHERSTLFETRLQIARDMAEDGADLVRELHPGIEAYAEAVAGDAREVLIDLSEDAHILVLGSRGRGTIRSLLLGSVSAAVVNAARCPVVVCRPPTHRNRIQGILVAADGTPESLPVIAFAFDLATARGRPLTVLHCFWDVVAAVAGFRESSGEILNEPHLEDLRLVLAESIAGFREKYPDVPVTTLLRHGLVDEALSERGRDWDLIVVGRHPVTSLGRTVFGSIASAVVERAHSNVAVVPEAASQEGDEQ